MRVTRIARTIVHWVKFVNGLQIKLRSLTSKLRETRWIGVKLYKETKIRICSKNSSVKLEYFKTTVAATGFT